MHKFIYPSTKWDNGHFKHLWFSLFGNKIKHLMKCIWGSFTMTAKLWFLISGYKQSYSKLSIESQVDIWYSYLFTYLMFDEDSLYISRGG